MTLTKWFSCFFKTQLPQGMTEFNEWVEDVSKLSGLPSNEKLRRVTAEFIIQLPPTMSKFSKRELARQMKKAASNQVAFEAVSLINEEKKEKEPTVIESINKPVGPKAKRKRVSRHRRQRHRTA